MHNNTRINFDALTARLSEAHEQERHYLYEHEVYDFLANLGSETPPRTMLIPRGEHIADEDILALPGDKAVLKIVSPTILHKTEVGGVRIVDKDPNKIRSTARRSRLTVVEASVARSAA